MQKQARMLIEAKTAILNSGDSLPATAIPRLLGPSRISRIYPYCAENSVLQGGDAERGERSSP